MLFSIFGSRALI